MELLVILLSEFGEIIPEAVVGEMDERLGLISHLASSRTMSKGSLTVWNVSANPFLHEEGLVSSHSFSSGFVITVAPSQSASFSIHSVATR